MGKQNVSSAASAKEEAWRVFVRVQACDARAGYLCGSMEALAAQTPVVTFWEGEIVDNQNHHFITNQWEARRGPPLRSLLQSTFPISVTVPITNIFPRTQMICGGGRDARGPLTMRSQETDVCHWSKFPSFGPLRDAVQRDGGKSIDLATYPCVFMRWKEKFFVNAGSECGLTIAGFYYVCLAREDGAIHGFYYDPHSSPFQKLELQPTNEGRFGYSSATYKLS
eukprot:SM000139S00135  [mRNA]  locus=s139:338000:339860:+ [translate_table: standard]